MPDNANHAIRDGDYPLVYISGDRGLYKYFPDSRTVAKMKAIELDEQGQMVGYGALTKKIAISGALEIVVMPVVPQGGISSDQDWVRHFVPGDGWLKKAPPLPGKSWFEIDVSPHDPNKWVVHTGIDKSTDWESKEIFVTADSGVTWTQVDMAPIGSSVRIFHAGWSSHTPDFLWVAAHAKTTSTGSTADAWYGNPFTGQLTYRALHSATRQTKFLAAAVMETGDFVVRGQAIGPEFTYIVAPDGSFIRRDNLPPTIAGQIIGLLGTNNILGLFGPERTLYRATHYNLGEMENSQTGTHPESAFAPPDGSGRGYIEVLTGMRWFLGRPYDSTRGIYELTNPFAGFPSLLPSYGQGFPVGSVRADRQTRTTLVAISKRQGASQATLYVFKDAAWSEMAGPEDANPFGMSSTAIIPIVRPV